MKPLILTGWLIPEFTKSEFADLVLNFFFRFGWGPLPSPDELAAYLGTGTPDVKHGHHWSLEELPGRATGHGASELRILELIAAGYEHPFEVFPHFKQRFRRRVFGYWEAGALLEGLALAPMPAVSGLAEWPFTPEMHICMNDTSDISKAGYRSPRSARQFWRATKISAGIIQSTAGGAVRD